MTLLQLKYFREVVIYGSVTKAAKRLNVTQPAVSKQLSLLAQELNCELWEKRKQKLRLTEAGRVIFHRGELMLEQARLINEEVSDLNAADEITGSITVGCGPLLSRSLLPELSVNFIQQYPKVNLSIYESDSVLLPGLLEDGTIDIGLGAGNISRNSKIRFTPLLKDEYLIIHSTKLILPGDVFQVEQLCNYPFINYIRATTVLTSLVEGLKLKGLNPILYACNVETVLEFVKRNAGIAFMPSYLFKILKPEGIVSKKIDKPVYQNIGIYYLQDKNKKPVYKLFKKKVREAFEKLS